MAIAKESTQMLWLDFKCLLKACLKSWCSGRYYWERTFKVEEKSLGHWGHALGEYYGTLAPYSFLHPGCEGCFASPMHAYVMMCCLDIGSKQWSQLIMDHKTDKSKSLPFISWFHQVICYSFRKLANSSALLGVGISSLCTRWGPVPLSIPENQHTKFPISEVVLKSIWKKCLSFLSSENSPLPLSLESLQPREQGVTFLFSLVLFHFVFPVPDPGDLGKLGFLSFEKPQGTAK